MTQPITDDTINNKLLKWSRATEATRVLTNLMSFMTKTFVLPHAAIENCVHPQDLTFPGYDVILDFSSGDTEWNITVRKRRAPENRYRLGNLYVADFAGLTSPRWETRMHCSSNPNFIQDRSRIWRNEWRNEIQGSGRHPCFSRSRTAKSSTNGS